MKEETLYRYFKCQTTADEELRIADWLDADPTNRTSFDQVHALFLRNVLADKPAVATPTSRPMGLMQRFTRYAAGVAAALALASGAAWWSDHNLRTELSERQMIVEVPAGQRIRLTLEDGSAVWLNAGSKLEYPALFANEMRRVKIAGEAMFEVTHNPKRPFVVETFASRIEVLGTKFNVVADQAENRFSTSLVEGSVRVTNLADGAQALLEPNQMVRLIDGRLSVTTQNDPTSLRWTEGLISLKGLSFAQLITKFEKAYDVKIVISCAQMPATDFTSGKIRISDGIDHALRILQHGAKFTYTKDSESNTITIL